MLMWRRFERCEGGETQTGQRETTDRGLKEGGCVGVVKPLTYFFRISGNFLHGGNVSTIFTRASYL